MASPERWQRWAMLVAWSACALAAAAGAAAPADCRGLLALTDATTTVMTAELVRRSSTAPEHCRIEGLILPAVGFEVRLPLAWNGKFLMVGNGGYLGAFFDQSMGLVRGYATASTDTGHRGPSPTFAHDNRAAEIDFGFRAVHVSALAAKRLIAAFYGRPPRYAYFRGCSTGGRQGLMEAQRFPADFDGLSIGAPIYDYTLKQIYNAAWVAQALFADEGAGYVPRRKLAALGAAVYARCDGLDGLEDGLIDDPRNCDFEPSRDLALCPADTDRDDCFFAAQIEAISKIYDGPGSGYPGHVHGGEWLPSAGGGLTGGWDVYFTGQLAGAAGTGSADGDAYGGNDFEPVQLRNARSFFRFLAFEQDRPDFDVLSDLDFAAVPDTSFMASLMNATEPDLSALHERGGKILMWHGWADVGLNPLRTIEYFEQVRATLGQTVADDLIRLFMVPGMYHCSGGPGPDRFDDLSALERWVEEGVAPQTMLAVESADPGSYASGRGPGGMAGSSPKAAVTRSRLLCAYPRVARYRGTGSPDSAESFECRMP